MFSGCTVPPDSKETKLGSSNQEDSPSAGKNTGVVLVPCSRVEVRPYSYLRWCGYFWGPWVSFVPTDEWPVARGDVASLSLFYRYYLGRYSSELAQLVPLPCSRGRSTRYSDRLHDFSVTFSRCYKDVYVNSFFPGTAKLRNSLSIECFPLTFDLSDFKSRINRHL